MNERKTHSNVHHNETRRNAAAHRREAQVRSLPRGTALRGFAFRIPTASANRIPATYLADAESSRKSMRPQNAEETRAQETAPPERRTARAQQAPERGRGPRAHAHKRKKGPRGIVSPAGPAGLRGRSRE